MGEEKTCASPQLLSASGNPDENTELCVWLKMDDIHCIDDYEDMNQQYCGRALASKWVRRQPRSKISDIV